MRAPTRESEQTIQGVCVFFIQFLKRWTDYCKLQIVVNQKFIQRTKEK